MGRCLRFASSAATCVYSVVFSAQHSEFFVRGRSAPAPPWTAVSPPSVDAGRPACLRRSGWKETVIRQRLGRNAAAAAAAGGGDVH